MAHTPKVTCTASRSMTKRGRSVMHSAMIGRTDVVPLECTSGAAVGGDTIFALFALFLWPDALHRICIPDYKHNEDLVAVLRVRAEVGPEDIEIIETGLGPLERDLFMLTHAEELWAFPSSSREQIRGSGTWYTIRAARELVIPTFIYPLNGEEFWTENV